MAAKKAAAPKTAKTPKAAAKKVEASTVAFSRRLVLFRFFVRRLGADSFEVLRAALSDPALEGVDAEGVSNFCTALIARLEPSLPLQKDDLLRWDRNILRHTAAISKGRSQTVRWKYFQYLALLFTEMYLDAWFEDPEGLRAQLNEAVEEHNLDTKDNLGAYEPGDLRTLAFWAATGSGKTLLMHVNLLQFRAYLAQHKRESTINRTLLVTPQEELSRQHIDELKTSGLAAVAFSKGTAGALFSGRTVEVIESTKLRADDGDKTVAVEAFEANNLVLIDEGHHGASGKEEEGVKAMRDALSTHGFAFEYSATFGQAMKAAKKPALEADYARNILFDYAYRRYHADGYGKDFRVLNLDGDGDAAGQHRYLTACLLAFYQQLRLYLDRGESLRPYGIERPLWIFVGASVNAVKGDKGSDVQRVLRFLAQFVADKTASAATIDRLLQGKAELHDAKGRDLFDNAFPYLAGLNLSGAVLFSDVLTKLFNATAPAKVHVERLEGADGEFALRLGDAKDPFGLINVGDAAKLAKLLKETDKETLVVTDQAVSESIFDTLRRGESKVNILIGSQKFTTGWDTARVSTMGLLNVGKGEGSKIIQLFGRGVRLRGYGLSLKRSSKMPWLTKKPPHLKVLETLQVFGVGADYMQTFERILRDEEVTLEGDREVVEIPVTVTLPPVPLKTIQLRDGLAWERDGDRPRFGEIGAYLLDHPVNLDWFPRVRLAQSDGVFAAKDEAKELKLRFRPEHVACLELDALVGELEMFRREKGWTQVGIERATVRAVLESDEPWYELLAPADTLDFDDPARKEVWQEIAKALLLKYLERIARIAKANWEKGKIRYADVVKTDVNLTLLGVKDGTAQGYRVEVDVSDETLLNDVRKMAVKGEGSAKGGRLRAIVFARHLFSPVLWVDAKQKPTEFSVQPVALNRGEGQFVEDLRKWCELKPSWLDGRQLYLLRNRSQTGVGFFEEGGFYPDFILWVLEGSRQHIAFVDPKGIRNLKTLSDPKITLHRRIKDIEQELGDPNVSLHSFIVSNTALNDVNWKGEDKVEDFAREHVFFQSADGAYVGDVLEAIAPLAGLAV